MIGFVYKLVDPETLVAIYVGSTKGNCETRLRAHVYATKTSNAPIYKFLRENGMIPKMEILEEVNFVSIKELRDRERHWIRTLGDTLQNGIKYKYNEPTTGITLRPKDGSTLRCDLMELADTKKWSLNQYAIEVLEDHVKKLKPKKK